jgi:Leucine-rich repeat (LRR) protein
MNLHIFVQTETFLWDWTPPNDRSGGIQVCLNKDKFEVLDIIHGNFILKFKLRNKVDGFEWCLLVVYGAAQDLLWEARVVALDLASLNIMGSISPCIAELNFLTAIDMASSRINGHIPPEISKLAQLRYLNLSMNSLTGMIPETISSCSDLEVIRITNNSIQGEIPPSIAKLEFLQKLV